MSKKRNNIDVIEMLIWEKVIGHHNLKTFVHCCRVDDVCSFEIFYSDRGTYMRLRSPCSLSMLVVLAFHFTTQRNFLIVKSTTCFHDHSNCRVQNQL